MSQPSNNVAMIQQAPAPFQMLAQANQSFHQENGKTTVVHQKMVEKLDGVFGKLIEENSALRERAILAESREREKDQIHDASIKALNDLMTQQDAKWEKRWNEAQEQIAAIKARSKETGDGLEKRIDKLEKEDSTLSTQQTDLTQKMHALVIGYEANNGAINNRINETSTRINRTNTQIANLRKRYNAHQHYLNKMPPGLTGTPNK